VGPEVPNISGVGDGPPPAGPRSRRFLDADEWRGARRAVGILAVVLALVGAVMWLLSFVPGAPTAGRWQALVMPAFVLMFIPFGLMVINEGVNRPGGSRRSAVPAGLRGWRAVVAAVVFGAVWLSGAFVFLGGGLSGQPMEKDGVYTSNDHGVVTVLTEEEWRAADALASRLFAGGVFVFATIAALVRTRPPDDVDLDEQHALARLHEPHDHPSVALADLRGHRRIEATVPGTVDEDTARLRTRMPIRTSVSASGATRLVGDGDAGALGWPLRPSFPMLVDGELTATTADAGRDASTAVDLSLRPATRGAEAGPLGALWALVIVGLGYATVGRFLPFPMSLAFVAFAGFGLFAAYRTATGPRRAAALVEAQVVGALHEGEAPAPPGPA
jgi:hypothetical protein